MALKTSISQITVANDKIAREVSLITKTDIKDVRKMMKFIGRFIADTIERGQMEAVMLPYLGKFKPKNTIKVKEMILAYERSGFNMVYQAIKGKPVIDARDKSAYDRPRKVKPPKSSRK